jgi:YHS domain-containing protein
LSVSRLKVQLTLLETNEAFLRAGYTCPCGCTPSVQYDRGAELVEEGCCCGNQFAVGPSASVSLIPAAGFRPETQAFDAPWGQRLEAAWLVGPSVHGPAAGHDHGHDADGGPPGTRDPVCGMTVEPETARANGLHSTLNGAGYYFCGKGCKLEFDEDPKRYLDPGYVPSM